MERWREFSKKITAGLKRRFAEQQFKAAMIRVGGTVFLAYFLASCLASLSVVLIFKAFDASARAQVKVISGELNLSDTTNYHLIKKEVMARNIFNTSGEFPPETEKVSEKTEKTFNLHGACNPTALKATLLGVIVMGDATSVAVVKDPGSEDADIYRKGDYIIDADNAQVAAIQENLMILNNAGTKECLYTPGFAPPAIALGVQGKAAKAGAAIAEPVTLQASWVEAELGDGFSKILQSARLVPNAEGAKVKGFKIFAIQSGSLFDKIGLRDGDIIVQVNETVLEAEQGFTLYQSFLDEKNIVINILRGESSLQSLRVQIR